MRNESPCPEKWNLKSRVQFSDSNSKTFPGKNFPGRPPDPCRKTTDSC